MNNFEEEDKIWTSKEETRRRGSIGNQLPAIQEDTGEEENENDFGKLISGDFGNDGDQITLPEQLETEADEKVFGNVLLGGANRSSLAISKR